MSETKICKGMCKECGRVILSTEPMSRIGGKNYHRYCWVTKRTVAKA